MVSHSSSRCVSLIVAAGLFGCIGPRPPDPETMAPPAIVPGATGDAVLAVLDFVDERPIDQRGDGIINDGFASGRYTEIGPYWTIIGDSPSGLSDEPSDSPRYRVRWTGEGSFRWYRYPGAGIGGAQAVPTTVGLADYLAHALARRGLARRVFRASSREEAARGGATHVLEGSVYGFAGLFAQLREPIETPLDDPRDYLLESTVRIGFRFLGGDGNALLEREFQGVDEDLHLFDDLTQYRGNNVFPHLRLDQNRNADMIFHDMVQHVQRGLRTVTLELLTEVEALLAR